MSPTNSTLYERLGGEPAVRELAGAFYFQVFGDPRLARFFNGVDAQWLLEHQVQFLSTLLGAETRHAPVDLFETHRDLIQDGLTDAQFDAVALHLRTAALDLALPLDLVTELMKNVGDLRDVFFGRT